MRTEDLISLLSTGVAPVDPRVSARRFGRALVLGGAGAAVLMAVIFGLRPDLAVVVRTPLFWARLAFPVSLAAAALLLLTRLSRPGTTIGKLWAAPAVPVVVVWIAAVAGLCLGGGSLLMDRAAAGNATPMALVLLVGAFAAQIYSSTMGGMTPNLVDEKDTGAVSGWLNVGRTRLLLR